MYMYMYMYIGYMRSLFNWCPEVMLSPYTIVLNGYYVAGCYIATLSQTLYCNYSSRRFNVPD